MRYLFLIIVVYLLSACKKCKTDDSNPELNYLSVKLQPFFGIDSLYLDSSYITSEGYRVKFTDIKCFFILLRFCHKYLLHFIHCFCQ